MTITEQWLDSLLGTQINKKAIESVFPDPTDLFIWLKKQDIHRLSQEVRFATFEYLCEFITLDGETNDRIKRQNIPANGETYIIPCLEEEFYSQDIDLLARLIFDADYSEEVTNKVFLITNKTLQILTATQAFRSDAILWSTFNIRERYNLALGIIAVQTMCMREATDLPFSEPTLLLNEYPNSPDFIHVGQPFNSKENVRGEISVQKASYMTDDVAGFCALILHEQIHSFFHQLAHFYYQGKISEEHPLYADAKLAYARKKHHVGVPGKIASLYFSDSEERCCYTNQFYFERHVQRFSPNRQIGCSRSFALD